MDWLFGNKKEKFPKGTVEHNAQKMKKKYPLNKDGFFGEKGRNKRVIYSKNQKTEAKRFYSKVSKGGKEESLSNGHGVRKIMKDGGVVSYREKTSTIDSPAVDLNKLKSGKVKNQKIHFIKKEKKDEK